MGLAEDLAEDTNALGRDLNALQQRGIFMAQARYVLGLVLEDVLPLAVSGVAVVVPELGLPAALAVTVSKALALASERAPDLVQRLAREISPPTADPPPATLKT